MSGHPDERELAHYVEGDLDGRARLDLQAHLEGCERCEAVRQDLETSQGLLKSLNEEPLAEDALARVRTRVLAAVPADGPLLERRPAWGWTGAVAATVAVLALAALVLLRGAPGPSPPITAGPVATAPPAPGPPDPRATPTPPRTMPAPTKPPAVASHREALEPPPQPSTVPAPGTVSPGQGGPDRVAVPRLSPEDADQLARAVLHVSRITALSPEADPVEAAPPESGQTLVRLTTADPDIVIYWQLDANGG